MKKIIGLSIAGGTTLIFLILLEYIGPFYKSFNNSKPPQIIFVLGGDIEREKAGIRLARALEIPLLFSGGSNPEHAIWLAQKSNLAPNQLILDYRAHDTVSNFTSIIDELNEEGINHALLITSEDHLPRAIAVGTLIAGSKGIRLTGISISCQEDCKDESFHKKFFDVVRASLWVLTGIDIRRFTMI